MRDHKTIYYANLVSTQYEFDEDGNRLDQPIMVYEEVPHILRATVSPNQGEVATKAFGNQVEYDNVIITERTNLTLNESTRFWIDQAPNKPHNYEVRKVSRTHHMVMIAIKRVSVSY